jgi:hypothetical protein
VLLLLPARSLICAVTVMVLPSAGLAKVVVTYLLVTSLSDTVTVLVVVPSLSTTWSPALTVPVQPALTDTVVALPISAPVMKPSLLVSVVMSTTGAAPALGAMVSIVMACVVLAPLP